MNNRVYHVEKFTNHEDMEKGINAAVQNGWELVHYAIQGTSARGAANHYIVLVRTVAAS